MRGSEHVHSGRIPYLDGWRGLSLLLVLLGHFGPRGNGQLAQLGVEMFFVLSGRLMADILFVERYPILPFYARRVSRIFPALLAFVLLTWLGLQATDLAYKPAAAALALTFTLNYGMVATHGVAAIENLWSLCIEEHAYLLLGVLAILARRGVKPIPALAVLAALSMADGVLSTVVLHQGYRTVYWRTDAHVASIFAGAIAYLSLRKLTLPRWVPLLAFVAGAALWLLPDVAKYSLATSALALSVGGLKAGAAVLDTAMSWKPLRLAGIWSYSSYLWQQPFNRLALAGAVPAWAALGLSIAFGLISYYYVEQPARRYLNRRIADYSGRAKTKTAPSLDSAAPA